MCGLGGGGGYRCILNWCLVVVVFGLLFFLFFFSPFFSFLAFVYLCVLKRTHVCVLCMCVCYALQLSVE